MRIFKKNSPTIIINNTNNTPKGDSDDNNKTENQPDKSKTYWGIILPIIIAGLISGIGYILKDIYDKNTKTSEHCIVKDRINAILISIEKAQKSNWLEYDDDIVLDAYEEKFQIYLLTDKLCKDNAFTKEIVTEIEKSQTIINKYQHND